ncbi:chemotaxis protein CheW [Desulfurobacterium atlanticum]|uniref:Purine-binding chemotaxis protein CheW n=1 Tax=Desulfurobacterium atlanticum TaxID=240169 RepID=A0A238ZZ07_9BACT|nr:chemotaxis protein CheW [Desulfurobacterium atlanticum]SNR88499.1 purine-binding chemotaxis protein CheW [Desulfurobacterium atlanticum]
MQIEDGKKKELEIEEIVGATVSKEIQVIGFELGRELVGIPIEEIIEITTDKDITPVPKSPEFVLGVMNLRGKIVPVTTVKKKLGIPEELPEDIYSRNKIIILDTEFGEVGIIVDEIVGSIKFFEDDVLPEPTGTIGIEIKHIKGVVQLEDNKLLIILNTKTIFSREES